MAATLAACVPTAPPATVPAPSGPAQESDRAGLRTVGVTPFAVAPGDSALAPLAYAFADLLTTDLARSGRLTMVERARLGDVLRELDLSATGRVDQATAPRVGRLLQAGQLVVGALSTSGRTSASGTTGTLRLGVRLTDVRTGAVDQAVDATAPLSDVLAAEKALAFRLFDALGITLTPAERAIVEQRPTANLAALLAYGRGLQRQVEGDFRAARTEFLRAAKLDPGFRGAADRAGQVRSLGETGTATPVLVPGLRPIDGAVSTTVDRLNRPLDGITTLARPASATDPSFPITTTTVVLVITRP